MLYLIVATFLPVRPQTAWRGVPHSCCRKETLGRQLPAAAAAAAALPTFHPSFFDPPQTSAISAPVAEAEAAVFVPGMTNNHRDYVYVLSNTEEQEELQWNPPCVHPVIIITSRSRPLFRAE